MTDDHPIYLADGRLASYNPAGTEANYKKVCVQLKEGDKILDINGNKVTVNSIQEISGKEKKRLEKAYGFYLPDVIDEIQEKSKDQGFDIMSDSDFDAQFYNQ